ncbi:MAG: putative lipid II flippase FtsW [Burkholderiaceae bacterium]|nr:putative lipid II flippase FtsW [Burkholderiaceae bacterium]
MNLPHFLKISPRTTSTSPLKDGLAHRASLAQIDTSLLISAVLLLLCGLVMVYSASVALPDEPRFANYKPTHFLIRHFLFIGIGIIAGLLVFQIPMSSWQRWAPILFVGGLLLLIIVLIPGVGKGVNGARRWIPLFILNLQPSELMKLFVILYGADYAVRKQAVLTDFKAGLLPIILAIGAVGGCLLLQPDLGALIVITGIAIGILFLGGMSLKIFLGSVGTLISVFLTVIALSPWRRERIFAYWSPWDENNALGKAYQLTHSLIAFGRGEMSGVGLGASVEKLHYLPEAHTDFIMAIIAEELGFIGVLLVVSLFYFIVRRAFEIGRQAIKLDKIFAGLVAQGIGIWIGLQAFINIGVASGLLPTKGLTLPFISYGGSAMLMSCVAIGILIRIDFESRQMMRGRAI